MRITDYRSATVGPRQLLDLPRAGGKVAGLAVAPELPLWQSPNPIAELIQCEPALPPLQRERPMLGVAAVAHQRAGGGAGVLGGSDDRDGASLSVARYAREAEKHWNQKG